MSVPVHIVNDKLISREQMIKKIDKINDIINSLYNSTSSIIRIVKKKYKKLYKKFYEDEREYQALFKEYIEIQRYFSNKYYIQYIQEKYKNELINIQYKIIEEIKIQIQIFVNEINKREKEGLEQKGNTIKIKEILINPFEKVNFYQNNISKKIINFNNEYDNKISNITQYLKEEKIEIENKIKYLKSNIKQIVSFLAERNFEITEKFSIYIDYNYILKKAIYDEWEF